MSVIPSPLLDRHEQEGARLGDFAGWRMPISYEGTVAEHTAVRERVGVFDVSHLGTVWVRGEGARDVVDGSFTNDPSLLGDGGSQYTLCAGREGGVLDDLIVYRLTADRWMAVPNAANTGEVVHRLDSLAVDSSAPVEIVDESTEWAILAVQGPSSPALLREVLDVDIDALSFGQHRPVTVRTVQGVICRTGYTGERGAELVVPVAAAGTLWDDIRDAGAAACGLAARDTLRLEMGYPLHGNELSPTISPYEARLGWAVKLDGRSFVGHDSLRAAKQQGPTRRLWGLVGDGRRPPRAGMSVAAADGAVGVVTSGSFSPTLGVGVGLALLDSSVEQDTSVTVDVRGSGVPFRVVRPPLVDSDPR